MNDNKKANILQGIFILGIIIILIFAALHSVPTDEQLNKLCLELGYKNMTDKNLRNNIIECDNINYYDYSWIEKCTKYDKWGTCRITSRILAGQKI